MKHLVELLWSNNSPLLRSVGTGHLVSAVLYAQPKEVQGTPYHPVVRTGIGSLHIRNPPYSHNRSLYPVKLRGIRAADVSVLKWTSFSASCSNDGCGRCTSSSLNHNGVPLIKQLNYIGLDKPKNLEEGTSDRNCYLSRNQPTYVIIFSSIMSYPHYQLHNHILSWTPYWKWTKIYYKMPQFILS